MVQAFYLHGCTVQGDYIIIESETDNSTTILHTHTYIYLPVYNFICFIYSFICTFISKNGYLYIHICKSSYNRTGQLWIEKATGADILSSKFMWCKSAVLNNIIIISYVFMIYHDKLHLSDCVVLCLFTYTCTSSIKRHMCCLGVESWPYLWFIR